MKKRFTRFLILTLLLGILLSCGLAVQAKEPYASYYLGDNGAYPIPAPYEVLTVIDFKTTEEGRLSSPESSVDEVVLHIYHYKQFSHIMPPYSGIFRVLLSL